MESGDIVHSHQWPHLNNGQQVTGNTTELKAAVESDNWNLVNDLLTADDVCKNDIEQCCLLHTLANVRELSLSLVREVMNKILKRHVDINLVDSSGDSAVMVAARCDNTKMVMELLSRQADLPQEEEVCAFLLTLTRNWKQNETPYMHALVLKQIWNKVKDKTLHTDGNDLRNSMIQLAVTFYPSLVREILLTIKDFDFNALGCDGMAILHRVAMFSDDDHVVLLHFIVTSGADINLQNSAGDTSLHIAAKHDNWPMMEALLRRGAASDLVNGEQCSVLHIIAARAKPQHPRSEKDRLTKESLSLTQTNYHTLAGGASDQIFHLLLTNSKDLDRKDSQGNTSLHLAAYRGNMLLMEKLLHHGASACVVNDAQKTALHIMATELFVTYYNLDLWTRFLTLAVKRGLDVRRVDSNGNSAIHLAAKQKYWTLVKCLLRFVDDIAQTDMEGLNVLHRFTMNSSLQDEELFRQLIEKVGDINAKTKTGDTAVHMAAKSCRWRLVKLLAEEGADMDELDSQGLNVLHRMAMRAECKEGLLSLVLQRTACSGGRSLGGETALHLAAKHGNWWMAQSLVEHGENADEADIDGLTVIQRLVMNDQSTFSSRHFSLFCRLLDLGADYTCRDENGDNVLHLSARNGNWQVVKHLLQMGESPDMPDSEGFFILHRVAASAESSPEQTFVLSFLLQKKNVALDAQTKLGDTALHLAARHKRWKNVETLIQHGANLYHCDKNGTSVLQRLMNCPSTSVLSAVQTALKNTENEEKSSTAETLLQATRKWCPTSDKHLKNQDSCTSSQHESKDAFFLRVLPTERFNEVTTIVTTKCTDLEENTTLHMAADDWNWRKVESLVQDGADFKIPDKNDEFVLQKLAKYKLFNKNEDKLLQSLIKKGADIKIRDANGDSLLHLAAKANNWAFLQRIVQEIRDFPLDELDSDGFHVLHRLALYDKQLECLDAMLRKGINLDTPSRSGDTCLHLAAKSDNWSFIQFLLEYKLKRRPASYSKAFSNPSSIFITHLLPKAIFYDIKSQRFALDQESHFAVDMNLDKRDCLGYTVWQLAVRKGQWNIIRQLEECDVKTKEIDDEGRGIMYSLASDKFIDFPALLKKNNSWFTEKDGLGNTPLHAAAKNKNLEFISQMLCSVCDVRSRDCDGFSPLHRVVQITPNSQKLEMVVKCLLKSGADLEELSWDGSAPVHLAAKSSNWSIVKLLLKQGARASACDSEGMSVLHRLVSRGYTEWPRVYFSWLIEDLLNAGEVTERKDPQGNTSLHLAVQAQNWDVVLKLVELGADLNEVDSEGYTAMQRLEKMQDYDSDLEIFPRYLFEKKAWRDMLSTSYETVTKPVEVNDSWSLIQSLLINGMFAGRENEDKYILHRLASSHLGNLRTDICDMLIENGLSLDAQDRDGNTAIHLAARAGNWKLAEHLIKKGARGSGLDSEGLSILHRFVAAANKELGIDDLNAILSSGVEVNASDPQGNTALHTAAKRRLLDIVDHLLNRANDPDFEDSNGFTVLLRLAQIPSPKCSSVCRRLLTKGANINICTRKGESALQLAVKYNNWPVVLLLLSNGARLDCHSLKQCYILHRIIKSPNSLISIDDQVRLFELLNNNGLPINEPDLSGKTPVELAVMHKKWKVFAYLCDCGVLLKRNPRKRNSFFHDLAKSDCIDDKVTDIARLLLDAALDINTRDSIGDIPVHLAADKGHWNKVKILVKCGADPNILDKNGYPLLHKIVQHLSSERDEFIKTLMKHGADVNRRGPHGKTALQIAAGQNDWEVVGWLIGMGAVYELTQMEKQSAIRRLHYFEWNDLSMDATELFINHITDGAANSSCLYQDKRRYTKREIDLHMCIEQHNWKGGKEMIKYGWKIRDLYREGPLVQVMMDQYSETNRTDWMSFFDFLISRRLDINVKLITGSGVLFHHNVIRNLTCSKTNDNILLYALLERGADPLLVDCRGHSLLRKVLDCEGPRALCLLKKLLPYGVTTHQPRLTEAVSQHRSPLGSTAASCTASPTEKALLDRNIGALELLINSGASSNAELFRLNAEFREQLAGQSHSRITVAVPLAILSKAARQPRPLKSLCRLTVSHCLGCGPDRRDKVKRLSIKASLKDFILFCDLLALH